jgi:hypothetical protein
MYEVFSQKSPKIGYGRIPSDFKCSNCREGPLQPPRLNTIPRSNIITLITEFPDFEPIPDGKLLAYLREASSNTEFDLGAHLKKLTEQFIHFLFGDDHMFIYCLCYGISVLGGTSRIYVQELLNQLLFDYLYATDEAPETPCLMHNSLSPLATNYVLSSGYFIPQITDFEEVALAYYNDKISITKRISDDDPIQIISGNLNVNVEINSSYGIPLNCGSIQGTDLVIVTTTQDRIHLKQLKRGLNYNCMLKLCKNGDTLSVVLFAKIIRDKSNNYAAKALTAGAELILPFDANVSYDFVSEDWFDNRRPIKKSSAAAKHLLKPAKIVGNTHVLKSQEMSIFDLISKNEVYKRQCSITDPTPIKESPVHTPESKKETIRLNNIETIDTTHPTGRGSDWSFDSQKKNTRVENLDTLNQQGIDNELQRRVNECRIIVTESYRLYFLLDPGEVSPNQSVEVIPVGASRWTMLELTAFLNHLNEMYHFYRSPRRNGPKNVGFLIGDSERRRFSVLIYLKNFHICVKYFFDEALGLHKLVRTGYFSQLYDNRGRLYKNPKLQNKDYYELNFSSNFPGADPTQNWLSNQVRKVATTNICRRFVAYIENILALRCRPAGELRRNLNVSLIEINPRVHASPEDIANINFGIWVFLISRTRLATRKVLVTYENETQSIEGLVHVMCEVSIAINHQAACCICLYATFRAFKPYVLVIPVVIIKNTYYPLGFALDTSESKRVYSIFFEQYEKRYGPSFRRLPVLSDGATSIESFYYDFGMTPFLCQVQ